MGMLVHQTQLLVMEPGFIIMTHNEKTINGMASSVSLHKKQFKVQISAEVMVSIY
jgi:hypothetical protein